MKDKTNGCCIVSCASLVLGISLLAMIDGKLHSGNTSLLPYSPQAAIRNVRYLDICLAGIILLRASVDTNNINCIVNIATSVLKLMLLSLLYSFHLTQRSIY